MRNRELVLAAPLALGAVVVLFLATDHSSRDAENSAVGETAGANGSPSALAAATPLGGETAEDASGAAVSSSAEHGADAASTSSAASSAVAIGAGKGGGARGGAGPVAQRPGGSHLYDGLSRRPRARVPSVLEGTPAADAKALQLQRAEDVAEKRGSIVGIIASVDATAIGGWAYDWNDLGTVVNVDVYVDNVLIGTVQANTSRPQFDPSNPSNPVNSRAWTCPSPKVLGDGDKHWVTALGYRPDSDSKRALQNSPWAFGGAPQPTAQLLWVGDNMVYGFATDPNAPGKPVTITILADGKVLATLTTPGSGHNADVFAQALALSPSKKSQVQLDGVTSATDPNLAGAIGAKAQALAASNRYIDFRPLTAADATLAYDELDFTYPKGDGTTIPLPGQERLALKFYRPGDDQQAFLFQQKDPIAASYLQVRVRSVDGSVEREAQRSPLQLAASTNRSPYGSIAFVSGNMISGYAVDADVLPAPISVDIVIDGESVGRIPADKKFDVLVNFAGVSEPMHGFTFTPPDRYLDGKAHTVQVFGVNQPEGINPELGGSPASFVGKRNAAPYGWLDSGDANGVSGWAYDPDAGAAPVSVEVWVDDVLYKTVTANATRTDLVPIVAAEPAHGYVSDVPATLKDGKQHTLRAFAIDVPGGPKVELAGSPKEINAQKPFVGIFPQDSPNGLTIASVITGTGAAVAGIAAGDVIKAFDDQTQKIDNAAFYAWVQTKEVGEQVVFRLYRDPALPAAPPPNPAPPGDPSPPLGANERLVLVTLGQRPP